MSESTMTKQRADGLPERWSAQRKTEIVQRVIRGEAIDEVAREIQMPVHTRTPGRAPVRARTPARRRQGSGGSGSRASLRNGGGLVKALGRGLVGVEGNSPF